MFTTSPRTKLKTSDYYHLYITLHLSVWYSFAKAHLSVGKEEGEKLTFVKLECGNTTRAFSYFTLSTIFGPLYSLKEKKFYST
jgi:hypothetical protein